MYMKMSGMMPPVEVDADGFVRVSAICAKCNMQFGRYLVHFGKKFVKELENEIGYPPVKVYNGGRRPGSWVHPRVLTDLALWLGGSIAGSA